VGVAAFFGSALLKSGGDTFGLGGAAMFPGEAIGHGFIPTPRKTSSEHQSGRGEITVFAEDVNSESSAIGLSIGIIRKTEFTKALRLRNLFHCGELSAWTAPNTEFPFG